MKCQYCGRDLSGTDEYRRREHRRLCKNATPEVRYIHSGIRQKEFPKDKDPRTETNALYDALAALVHLHGCEQEGIESGMPTPEQWEQAVDNAVIALKGARRES